MPGARKSSGPLRLFLLSRFQLEFATSKSRRPNRSSPKETAVTAPLLLPARKAQSLLAYLVLHPQPHTREEVASLFWGEVSDPQARGSLRRALTQIRRYLGSACLLADRETIQLNPAYPLWIDVLEFARLAALRVQLSGLSSEAAIRDLEAAVGLYRGDLLADSYEDWITPERERYHSIYIDVLLHLAQWMRSQGEYDRAIEFAHHLLVSEAANESAHQILIRCYLARGQRAAALKQYTDCQRCLHEELDVDPSPETLALYQQLTESEAPVRARETLLTNLPTPLTSFIGREHQLAELKPLLRRTRLLTLTGAGGCGKTRLAIRLATELADQFKDGSRWVELAAVTDPGLVPQKVAHVLSVSEVPRQPLLETLADHLRPKHLLLVLDNCEHLVEACAPLAETLLRGCPQLQILATSRQVLNVAGETAWIVPSLTVPDSQVLPRRLSEPAVLMQHESVQLLVERARAVNSDFRLSAENGPAVAQICQRLSGIPLAIELAAGRMKVLNAQQVAARLHDAFTLLTTSQRTDLPRHRTLYATIEWSYALLSEPEQILFRGLSVFAGDFSLDAVESICAGETLAAGAILDLLSGLANKSLLVVQASEGGTRYHLLELVREYAREKLDESGAAPGVQKRHLSFFLQLAERAAPELHGRDQRIWFNRLEQELDNLRAAFDWGLATEGETENSLRLATALMWFWRVRRYGREGRGRLERALARIGAEGRTETRLNALNAAGYIAGFEGDLAAAHAYGEQAFLIAQGLGNLRASALALAVDAGDKDATHARACWSQALALWREVGDSWGSALALNALGEIARGENDYVQARGLYEESLAIRRERGDTLGMAVCLNNLGFVEHYLGNAEAARRFGREAWALWREVGGQAGGAECLIGLAGADELEGTPESLKRSARLLAAVEVLLESIGTPMVAQDHMEYERICTRVHATLDESAFASAWAEGRALTLEQAGEYALAG